VDLGGKGRRREVVDADGGRSFGSQRILLLDVRATDDVT
jgi:hypothetical protein